MAQPRILAKLPPSTRVTSQSYARYHPRLRKYKDGFAGLDMQTLRTEGCKGESRWTTANNDNVTIFLPYRVCSRVQKLSPWYFGKCSAMRIVFELAPRMWWLQRAKARYTAGPGTSDYTPIRRQQPHSVYYLITHRSSCHGCTDNIRCAGRWRVSPIP